MSPPRRGRRLRSGQSSSRQGCSRGPGRRDAGRISGVAHGLGDSHRIDSLRIDLRLCRADLYGGDPNALGFLEHAADTGDTVSAAHTFNSQMDLLHASVLEMSYKEWPVPLRGL